MNDFIERDTDDRLTTSNGFLIAMIGQESRRRFMSHINKWGIGWSHQGVLGALLSSENSGTASQKQLGELVGIDPRNLVSVIDVLEQQHLVERVLNPSDRRRSGVRLTHEGRTLAQKIQKAASLLEADMFTCLNSAEQDTLHQLLLKLYRNME